VDTLVLNVVLAGLALLTSLAPIGGETWDKTEPKILKRPTLRGWLSYLFIVLTACVTIMREIDTQNTHEVENKQLNGNINNLQKQIQVSNDARTTSELRERHYLEELIILNKEFITQQKKPQTRNTSLSPRITLVENNINRYNEELRKINKRLSTSSGLNSSIPTIANFVAPPSSTDENQVRIVSDSYHIQKKEAFVFHVERLSKGIWEPLYNNEFRVDTSGKWYPIDGGPVPRFGLKGAGNVVLQITDIKGGVAKCSILFED